MGVIRWNEIHRTRSVDAQGHRDYTRLFRVYVDDKTDGPIEVMSAIPIYQWVSHYSVENESDPYALAQTANAQPYDGEQFCWDVSYTYSTKPIDTGSIANPTAGSSPPGLGASPQPPSQPSPPGSQSPQVRPWSLKFGAEQTQQAAPAVDKLFQKVRASNGQPYTGLQYDVALCYFELTIPRLTANFSKPGAYVNAVNSDTFMGFLPGILRCTGYDITSQFEQQWGYYFEVGLKFQIRNNGHVTQVLDEGTFWKVGFDNVKNTDKWSNPIDGAVLLDGAGGKLPDGGNPVVNEFLFYSGLPFQNIL
jgi:opacity protein-like surface antigen